MDERQERHRDESSAVIAHRLTTLEHRVEKGFATLNKTIIDTSITFVRLDLYLSERDSMRADMDALRRLAMWSLGLVCSTAIGAVVLGIIGMSGVFS